MAKQRQRTTNPRGNGKHKSSERLAHMSDTNDRPPEGSVMTQLFGISELRSQTEEIIGVFNPQLVNTDRRLQMRNDPDVAFALALLRAPIINMGYDVEGEDPIIKAFVDQELRRVYRNLAVGLSNALHFGMQLSEAVWESRDVEVVTQGNDGTTETKMIRNAWTYHKFKALDPRSYVMRVDNDEFAGAEQRINRIGISIKGPFVGTEKLVLWSFRREEVWGKLTGYAMSNHAYTPWWDKQAIKLFANRYFESKADPSYKARAGAEVQGPSGLKQSGFQYMVEQGLALKSGGIIVLPNTKDNRDNFVFDIEQLTTERRGDMFQAYLDQQSTQILRGYWITDRAATGESGSLAMAEVHAKSLSLTLQSILNEWVDEVVNPQVVRNLVDFNFGVGMYEKTKTRVNAAGLSTDTQELFKTLLTQLLQAEQLTDSFGKVTLLERLDGVNIAKTLGVPLRPLEEMDKLSEQRDERRPDFTPSSEGGDEGPGDINDEEIADDLTERGELGDEGDDE